jgi:prevent-host-death family protein
VIVDDVSRLAREGELHLMVTSARFVTMSAKAKARVVAAGEFKAKCLALFDEVETRGRSFVVTKRGRPVARIVPVASPLGGSLQGSLLHEDDLLAPVAVDWDAHA